MKATVRMPAFLVHVYFPPDFNKDSLFSKKNIDTICIEKLKLKIIRSVYAFRFFVIGNHALRTLSSATAISFLTLSSTADLSLISLSNAAASSLISLSTASSLSYLIIHFCLF